MAAGKRVKEEGADNDLIDRIAEDPAFPQTKEEIMGGFSERVMRGWSELTSQCEEKAIAVIHGGPISCIMRSLFEPEARYFKWVPDPGRGYTITVSSDTAPEFSKL